MIPYYRDVRGTDDGCGITQCLACGGQWEWRGDYVDVRFCMFCGIRFRGKLACREQTTPRWLYECQARLGEKRFYEIERQWWMRKRLLARHWVIVERVTWLNEDATEDWRMGSHSWPRHGSAHQVYRQLKELRAQAPHCAFRIEYKLQRQG